jgi:2-methylisocitrate lyase-like PEP mutase family enzyme
MTEVARKAAELRRLHAAPAILVLVNVWDVASARTVAALPGCRAIATGSWPIAASLGVPDGEVLSREEMLAVAGRIADAVDLPVTADLEAGYGATPADVAETVRRAIALGIVGCNLEDTERPLPDAVARVAAACKAADADSAGFVVNARLDMRVRDGQELDEAVERARAFVDAGAACVYPIALAEPGLIGEFVRRVGAPVNVLGRPGGPSVRELEALGVARVSFGPGPQGAAMAALQRIGADLLDGGDVDESLAFRPPV